MTALQECPAPGCAEQVDGLGGTYSTTRSKWCDAFASHIHSHCPGSFDMVGMETQHLRCGCYCHQKTARTARSPK